MQDELSNEQDEQAAPNLSVGTFADGLVTQVRTLMTVAHSSHNIDALIAEGLPEDFAAIPITLLARDKPIMSAALNLLRLLAPSPRVYQLADDLLEDIMDVNETLLASLSDEEIAVYDDAKAKVEAGQIAKLVGLDVDEFLAAQEASSEGDDYPVEG